MNLEEGRDPNIIDASPTKTLFISMLIRDLTLRDAIGDLVDNSVDGARSLSADRNYAGLFIKIEAYQDRFLIQDNCGGISVDTAREYAFRFGRPKGTKPTPNSIGQFGIGMKRALFKLGNHFHIKSVASTSEFELTVNVNEWEENGKDWEFKFDNYKENLPLIDSSERGTTIIVTDLRKDVIGQFSTSNFIKKLINEIEAENLYNILHGLKISINGHFLTAHSLELLSSANIKAAFKEDTIELEEGEVKVRMYAGISDPVLEDGGWYIFCNDRLVVGPEQTEITGWSGGRSNEGPKYHGQFNRFRGYVFFESENAGLLPWNTTKTSMDLDSPVYKSVRQEMIQLMKPVISFLNNMKKERENDSPPEERPLEIIVNDSRRVQISELDHDTTADKFIFPPSPPKQKPSADESRISYTKPKSQIEEVKKSLGVKTIREVGEKTFDYYYEMEIGD